MLNPLWFKIVNLQHFHSPQENYVLQYGNKENVGSCEMSMKLEIQAFRIFFFFLQSLIMKLNYLGICSFLSEMDFFNFNF